MVIDKRGDIEKIWNKGGGIKNKNIERLEIIGIDLRGIIPRGFLDPFPNLRSLKMSYCNIDTLPEAFNEGSSSYCNELLNTIIVDHNNIEKCMIGKFCKLKYVDFSNNKIKDPTGIIDLFREGIGGGVSSGGGGEIMILNLENNNIEYIDLKVIERKPKELMVMFNGNPIIECCNELEEYKKIRCIDSLLHRAIKKNSDKITREFCNRCSNRIGHFSGNDGNIWKYCLEDNYEIGNNILRVMEKKCHSCNLIKKN